MSQHKRPKRRYLMTAVVAVILILAGVAAIASSLWMQENEIITGAEVYEALVEKLKLPPTTEEEPETRRMNCPLMTASLKKRLSHWMNLNRNSLTSLLTRPMSLR